MKSLRKLLFALLIFFLLLTSVSSPEAKSPDSAILLEVTKILEVPPPEDTGTAKILFTIHSGPNAGDTLIHNTHQWGHKDYDNQFHTGKQFLATIEYENGERRRVILGQQRRDYKIIILFLAVSLLLFTVGRWEGLAGLGATLLTIFLLLFLLFPFVFIGKLILPTGIFICLATIIITILLIMRRANATYPIIISLVAVFVVIFLLTIGGLEFLQLDSSMARNSRLILTKIHTEANIQIAELWKLITVGIVLSTLGATMDVGVVIGSTIDEITRDQPEITTRRAFNSGMKVGSEILSTMINTLIFAYLGLLFPLLLALHVFEISWLRFINYDFVGIEILRVFIGLTGLSLVIPVTSFLTAWWCNKE